ncbi:secreted protein [Candidatus Magnetobacterium bavaricum]|uniref:Secreted protein n=1 Tax=Candidatus Magnetobacterium bavaricum TaxID=29290 RepID=A0A0F3GN57_9BACT|nr:secreted protein [Candidatus Magnetobacterium bavaricum]
MMYRVSVVLMLTVPVVPFAVIAGFGTDVAPPLLVTVVVFGTPRVPLPSITYTVIEYRPLTSTLLYVPSYTPAAVAESSTVGIEVTGVSVEPGVKSGRLITAHTR